MSRACVLFLVILPALFTSLLPVGAAVSDDGSSVAAGMEPSRRERFLDPEDGWLDLSGFLDERHGFVPLLHPITEPALGNGLLAAPIFIQANEPGPDGRAVRPNIGAVGGFYTEKDSKGIFGLHSGRWKEGRVETLVGVLDATLNLDFYGIGGNLGPGLGSVEYTMEATGGVLEVRTRVCDLPLMIGLRYLYAEVDASFEVALPPGVRQGDLDSKLGGPSMILSYDTRDNMFTPNAGSLAELTATFHEEIFGASSGHQRLDLVGIHYQPFGDKCVVGLRGDLNASFGETPFYARPYVQLRGVPALRYQGKIATSAEAELRWRFWKRFSLIAFGGIGLAGNDWNELDLGDAVFAGGGGFRYELARRYGLHMGVDVGVSEEDTALYITFGSAWMRP